MRSTRTFTFAADLLAASALGRRAVAVRVRPGRALDVEPWQRAVLVRHGQVVGVLDPGRHRRLTSGHHAHVVDVRPTVRSLPTQEVPTADGVTVKVTLAAVVRVEDVERFVVGAQGADDVLHLALQVALREVVAVRSVDDLVSGRAALGAALDAAVRAGDEPAGAAVGLVVERVEVKDLVLPGELRRAQAAVLLARAEGQAALERARGETAALRSMANAARLVDDHPALLQLRLLQELGDSTGHTVVLGSLAPGAAAAGTRAGT